MEYAYIKNGVVHQIISAEDPVFPGIPIELRYAPDIVANMVKIPKGTHVQEGWGYDSTGKKFTAPAAELPKLTED